MFKGLRFAMSHSILLLATLLLAGCDLSSIGRITVDNIEWQRTSGSVDRTNDSIVLRDTNQKTEMWGDAISNDLECTFELKFDSGKSDSSVGLEIWRPNEYSITFRGGLIKVVTAGQVMKTKKVESYIGKCIRVSLKANDKRLFAAIDGVPLIDEQNMYWKAVLLQPRLNADIGDTITLYSSSCVTK
ncbi:MAG: hypothetical protein ABIJ30_04360 [bacterium]